MLLWAAAVALSAGDAGTSLLLSPQSATAALHARFGADARVLSIDLRAEDLDVEVQDRAVPAHVDRFTFEEGALGEGEPVAVGRNRKHLEARLFPLSDVDLSILPRLVLHAETRAQTEDGRATHVRIERQEGGGDVASWGRPVIRVFVDGPRGGAYVEYGLDGRERDVKRW